ncbi:tetratricopeptide repeat-containing sensor histidine kinase [Chryseobacterium gallinarum]|nr:tetratricopeptide repeat-containing sensor histidine kinase [Chryseobacterium gallinarum]
MDSAFKYFNEASTYYLLKKDSIRYASSLAYLSIISIEQGDYYGSEELNTAAIKYLKQPRDNEYLLSIYNSIAISRKNLKDYKTAIIWYNKALNVAKKTDDKITIKNNIAIANAKMKNFTEAVKILDSLYFNMQNAQNTRLKSKILDNLAYTKFLQDSQYDAEKELNKALTIRNENNDIWGLNASYAHLSDFYSNINKQKSLLYANKMYEVATSLKSPDDKLEALQKVILLENDHIQSRNYFNIYQKLQDSLQTARNKAKNQFALIRYEAEKNKADFLKSKAENSQKENQILKQYIVLGILLIILVWLYFGFKRRKKRLQREKELEVKNTEIKYSKKVHDKVANKVYHVMSEVENIPVLDKDELLDKLENIYHISRDISYDDKDLAVEKDFSKQLSKMLKSYSSEIIKVPIIGNEEELWNGVSETAKIEVFYILQELMTNMKKHSKADRVLIDFERENNLITISYSDNGVGIQKHSPKNGLKNTESRINSINGTINFESTTEKGLKINLSFPAKN